MGASRNVYAASQPHCWPSPAGGPPQWQGANATLGQSHLAERGGFTARHTHKHVHAHMYA